MGREQRDNEAQPGRREIRPGDEPEPWRDTDAITGGYGADEEEPANQSEDDSGQ